MLRTWLARACAVLALGAVIAAVPLVIGSVQTHHSTSQSDVAGAIGRLSTANLALSKQLVALRPGASPHPPQAAIHGALAVANELAGEFKDRDDDLGARVRALVRAELGYLDAVGSSVANPRSQLLHEVVPKADALRAALRALPPGAPTDVRGETSLAAYSASRLGG